MKVGRRADRAETWKPWEGGNWRREDLGLKVVQQMAGAVKIEMTMERYVGDATKCSGYNATRTPRVLKVGGAVMGLFIYDLP